MKRAEPFEYVIVGSGSWNILSGMKRQVALGDTLLASPGHGRRSGPDAHDKEFTVSETGGQPYPIPAIGGNSRTEEQTIVADAHRLGCEIGSSLSPDQRNKVASLSAALEALSSSVAGLTLKQLHEQRSLWNFHREGETEDVYNERLASQPRPGSDEEADHYPKLLQRFHEGVGRAIFDSLSPPPW